MKERPIFMTGGDPPDVSQLKTILNIPGVLNGKGVITLTTLTGLCVKIDLGEKDKLGKPVIIEKNFV